MEIIKKNFKAILFIFLYLIPALTLAAETLIIEPDAGEQPLIAAIVKARSSIDLAMYGFTDQDLLNALIQAKQAGIQVRILLQHFPYRSTDENLPVIQKLSESHLNLAYTPPSFFLLHQKTLIIDHQLAVIMTFNFTRSSFRSERNFGLIITDPAQVAEIQSVFNADWQHQSVSPIQAALVWSPDNSRQKLLNLIANAKSEIKVYAQGLSDYELVGALASAARRGVNVQILTSDPPSSGKRAYLQKAGVVFHRDDRLRIHAKVLLIDHEKAALGSINFTQPSMDKNRELSVITTDPRVVTQLLYTFQDDWKESA